MTDRSVRGDGDNLYTDSVVALNPDTGKMKWYYQFTPNDGHDWDSTQDMMLVDRVWHGQNAQAAAARRSQRHFYVLDRTTGQFLQGTPFMYQNWNTGFDAKGRPMSLPGSNSSPEGSFFVYPTQWRHELAVAVLQSAQTGFFYLEYSENGAQYVSAPQAPEKGREYLGRGRAATPAVREAREPAPSAGVKALDVETGKTRGISSFPGCRRMACWRPPVACCSRQRAMATSSLSTRRPASISGTTRPARRMRPLRSATPLTASSTWR